MAQTLVNRRLLKADYDILKLCKNGEECELVADSAEGETYLVKENDKKSIVKVYKYAADDVDFCKSIKRIQEIAMPSIAKVIEYGDLDGHAYEKREYYEAFSLANHPELFVDVLRDLAEAISELHIEGFISLDLKPENIVITDKGAVIVDLGSLLGFRSDDAENAYTLNYCAPEIFNNRWCEANDFYSLGITLFEMLTQRNPFNGFSNNEEIQKIKLNPNWWFPPQEVGTIIGKLIYNLIAPNTNLRWGYSEIIKWIGDNTEDAIIDDTRKIISRFNGSFSYNRISVDKSDKLLEYIIKDWALDYLFEIGANISYLDTYIPISAGLCVAYNQGDVCVAEKVRLLTSLYCKYTPDSGTIYFNGKEYDCLEAFGDDIYLMIERLYYDQRSNIVNLDEINDVNYSVVSLALKSGCFLRYAQRANGDNIEARRELIKSAEQLMLTSNDLYNFTYNGLYIGRALFNSDYIYVTDKNGEKVSIRSHQELAEFIMDNFETIESFMQTFDWIIYRGPIAENTPRSSVKFQLSPIILAWNDYYCNINGIEAMQK